MPDSLETYVSCDYTECLAEKRVFGDDLPPGWVRRGKRVFCPEHDRLRKDPNQ